MKAKNKSNPFRFGGKVKYRSKLPVSLDWPFIFLPILAGFLQISCLIYCEYFWKPSPMKLVDPDLSFVCWLFCNALGQNNNPSLWLILASTGSVFSIFAGLLFFFRRNFSGILTALAGGTILFPLGLLTLSPIYVFLKRKRSSWE